MDRMLLSSHATRPQDWCAGWGRVPHERSDALMAKRTSKRVEPEHLSAREMADKLKIKEGRKKDTEKQIREELTEK